MSNNIPNNNEIIEELTNDFENQCLEKSVNKIINRALTDEDETKLPETLLPDDNVDEDELKQLEATLTESEVANRQQESINLKNKGNQEFRDHLYLESISTYTEGLHLCPLANKSDRAVLYSNRAAAKIKLKRLESAIDDCSKSIELNPIFIRAYMRRAATYEEKDMFDEALEDYKKVIEIEPSNAQAREAVHRLPPLIEARNEKLKEEMIGKLKDLGNMFLKPFGLSTNNFKMQHDPNTGGYSVNFQQ